MFGIVCKSGHIAYSTTLEGISSIKQALLNKGEIVSQIQFRSTLEALNIHLEGK